MNQKKEFFLLRVAWQIDQLQLLWHENQELETALPVSIEGLLSKPNIHPMKMT